MPSEKMKTAIIETSSERMNICRQCEFHSANAKDYKTIRPDAHCTKCGCTLSAKTKCLSCSCPIDKWVAAVTQEQEELIKKDDGKQRGSS